jgi:hypothetical protein
MLNRNITTHHAEDGSGVGSAIIAGASKDIVLTSLICWLMLFATLPLAMTKKRKDAGYFTNL